MEFANTLFMVLGYLGLGIMSLGAMLALLSAISYAKLQNTPFVNGWERRIALESEFSWGDTCASISKAGLWLAVIFFLLRWVASN